MQRMGAPGQTAHRFSFRAQARGGQRSCKTQRGARPCPENPETQPGADVGPRKGAPATPTGVGPHKGAPATPTSVGPHKGAPATPTLQLPVGQGDPGFPMPPIAHVRGLTAGDAPALGAALSTQLLPPEQGVGLEVTQLAGVHIPDQFTEQQPNVKAVIAHSPDENKISQQTGGKNHTFATGVSSAGFPASPR